MDALSSLPGPVLGSDLIEVIVLLCSGFFPWVESDHEPPFLALVGSLC